MAEDIDGALGIRATIDAADVKKGADEFIANVQRMQKAAESASDGMSDGFSFLKQQIETIAAAIEATRDKLTSISSAMGKVAPVDQSATESYAELKSQIEALTKANEDLQSKLSATASTIEEHAKASSTASQSLKEFSSATESANSGASSLSSSAKGQMKELGETIQFDVEQVKLMEQEYANLESKLASLQSKQGALQAAPTQSDPTAQGVQDNKMAEVNAQIEQTQAKMTAIKTITTEYKGEIAQCSQQMAQLSQQTGDTGNKSVTLRTELRNARQAVAEMILSGKASGVEFGKAVAKANQLQAAFNKASAAINGKNLAYNSFNLLSTAIGGVTGAMSTYMGVAGLFTDNQEELARIQKDLQAVMSVSMGVQQMMNAATQIGTKLEALKAVALASVTAEATSATAAESGKAVADGVSAATSGALTAANWTLATSFKAVSLAIKQVPVIGWIIAAVTALVAAGTALYNWITELSPEEKRVQAETEAMAKSMQKARETMAESSKEIGKNVAQYKQLQQKYNDVKGDSKKLNQFISENKDSFEDLGFSIENAADAENIFKNNTNAVIEGFKLRAKAAALAQIATDYYAESFRHQLNAEGWNRATHLKNNQVRKDKEGNEISAADYRAQAAQNAIAEANLGKFAENRANAAMDEFKKLQNDITTNNTLHGIKSPSRSTSSGGNKNSGKGGKGKTEAEITYENEKKWNDLILDEMKSYLDKRSELSNYILENMEDGAAKQYEQIATEHNAALKELDDWIKELANKRKETSKETWINSKEGRTEQQWSQTAQGKWKDKDWENNLMQTDPEVKAVYDEYNAAITNRLNKQLSDLVDNVLANYNTSEHDRTSQLKKLASDIALLEGKIITIQDSAQKEEAKTALARAKAQKEWVEQSKEAWNNYYKEFGTFAEKVKAINDQFAHDTQGMDKNSPEYKIKVEKRKEEISTLTLNELKLQVNWDSVFNDLSRVGKRTLEQLHEQLLTILENDKNLSIKDIQVISEQITKIKEEQSKKGFILGNAFSAIGDTIEAHKEYEQAQKAVTKAEDGNLWKRYQKAESVDEKERIKNTSVTDSVTGNVTTFGELLNKANKALKTYTEAQSKAANTIKQLGNSFNTIANIGKDVTEMLEVFGINTPDSIKDIFSGFSSIGSALNGFDLTHIGSFLDVGNYVHAITGVVGGIGKIFTGFADALGIGSGNWDAYEESLDNYNKMSKVWDSLIKKKTQYLKLSWGDEAKKTAEELEALSKTELEETKLIAKQYASAWKRGSHSAAYKFDKRMNGGLAGWTWADVSSATGVSVSSMTQLFDLSAEQLEKLKTANTAWWVELDEQTRNYLDQIIELGDTAEDTSDAILEKLTGITFDNMKTSFMDCLSDMSKGSDDFVSEFQENIRTALINNTIGTAVTDWMKDFTERYQTDVKNNGGTLTEEKINAYRKELQEAANNFMIERDKLVNNLGIGTTTNEEQQKSGYSTASEESIEVLSGRALAAQVALYELRDLQTANNDILSDTTNALNQVVNIESKRTEYYDESIEIQRTSVTHLASIAKNTNELYAMNERLAKIEKNTRNI